MRKLSVGSGFLAILLLSVPLAAKSALPAVQIRLPERFRVLTGQYFDLRVEATGLSSTGATLQILVDGVNITPLLPAPEVTTDNDNAPADLDKAWVFRKVSFPVAGERVMKAVVTDGAVTATAAQDVC